MTSLRFDPTRLNVAAFAKAQAVLDGRTPLARLPRLAQTVVQPADGAAPDVSWSAQGLWRHSAGRAPEMRLHLKAQTTLWLTCQRCLQPASHGLQVDSVLRFVADEAEAERLDEAQDEEDVLALPRALKLDELIEDELILALPIVPLHAVCPQPLDYAAEPGAEAEAQGADHERPNPFAALAALKKPPGIG